MASPAKQTAKQKRNLPKVIVDAIAKKKGKGGKKKPLLVAQRGTLKKKVKKTVKKK